VLLPCRWLSRYNPAMPLEPGATVAVSGTVTAARAADAVAHRAIRVLTDPELRRRATKKGTG
jgi:hypothetical protein